MNRALAPGGTIRIVYWLTSTYAACHAVVVIQLFLPPMILYPIIKCHIWVPNAELIAPVIVRTNPIAEKTRQPIIGSRSVLMGTVKKWNFVI